MYINTVDAGLWEQEDKVGLQIELELVNTGEVHLSGCNTYYHATDSDGMPVRHWAGLLEPGGETWDIAPGAKHNSVAFVPRSSWVPQGTDSSTAYYVMWFECQSASLVTVGYLYGIDMNKMSLIPPPVWSGTEVRFPMREVPAMGSYERATFLSELREETPGPMPVPSPQFTIRGSAEED